MHKMFKINQTKIKGGCQSGRKVATHNSKSDLPLMSYLFLSIKVCSRGVADNISADIRLSIIS